MIANAMGPQNTVGAIGISPRTVDAAVSISRSPVLTSAIRANHLALVHSISPPSQLINVRSPPRSRQRMAR